MGMLGLGSTFPTAWWRGHDGSLGTTAAWARWHGGHGGTAAASATRWHCVARHKAPSPLGQILGWAKLCAMPAPWPCQIVSRAKPWVMPNHGLCQIVSRAKS